MLESTQNTGFARLISKDIMAKGTVTWILVVVMAGVPAVWAQGTTASISGTILDETGAVLPGVTVTVTNPDTGISRTVITDDEGSYRIPQLAPGTYELRAELIRFQMALVQGITLNVAQEVVTDVTLRVGEMTEEVVISAQVSRVETTTPNVGGTVDGKSIRDLPLNGRDFIQLAALHEGVVMPTSADRNLNAAGDEGIKISIGGARPHENAILLDGTDIKNWYGGTPGTISGNLLGVDSIRELRIITSAYSAEYGRFSGGVISLVTRSGTNQLHGSLFAFHRNSALDARNFFDRDPDNPLERSDPPESKRNQFGFTLGGPIKRDQTFFFGSYEGLRERLTTTGISTFPNADAHKGLIPNERLRGRFICGDPFQKTQDLCDVGVDRSIRPYIDLYPLPNGTDFGDGSAQFFFPKPQPKDQDHFVVKIDHKFSDSDSFFVRYTLDDGTSNSLTEAFIYGVDRKSRNQYFTLEQKHVFSPTLLNEVRVAYNRSHGETSDFENVPVDPSLYFMPERGAMGLLLGRGSGLSGFGSSSTLPRNRTLNTFQYIDNLVWIRGKHSMKMGVNWRRFQYNLTSHSGVTGFFQYGTLKDLLEATFNQASVLFTDPFQSGMRQNLIGLYFQDNIQLRPNLTVNLGLRYEFITSPREVAGRLGNLQSPFQVEPTLGNPYFENPSLKNFSPRLGFAWDPRGSGKFSIRGGFGLYFQQILQRAISRTAQSMPPFNVEAVLEGGDEIIFPTALRDLTADAAVAQPNGVIITDPEQPYLMQWSLTLERQLTPNTAVTATYAGSRGVHLSRAADVNRPPSTLIDGRYFYDQGDARANPAWASLTDRRWDANSYYNALKLGLKKRFSSGFQYQLSYQWQKMMDEGSNVITAPRPFRTSNFRASNWLDRKIDRGLSAYHTAHVLSSHWMVELPFGGGRGLADKLIGGWQVNGIVRLSTGTPINIEGNPNLTCRLCGGGGSALRPNLVSGRSNNPRTGDPNQWFDPSAFENQEARTFGNLGRNTGEGPGLATLDLSILKSFFVAESANVQFRAEFFNIFNRANFQGPLRTRAVFNRGGGGGPNGNFGQILGTVTPSRQIQLALKIVF